MSKSRVETRNVADIKIVFYVRASLNEEHALHLAELIESGVVLPPIKITPEGVLIDGRHRLEAHNILGRKEISCEVVEGCPEEEMIAEAYRSNMGGSLPPGKMDLENTIAIMLARSVTKKRIVELLGLPTVLTRKYITSVELKLASAALERAAKSVTDGGLTVVKAAEQHNVDLDKLREKLSGKKRRGTNGVSEIKRNLTKAYRSFNPKHSALLRSVLTLFEDGDLTEKQAEMLLAHSEHLQQRLRRTLADWKNRFKQLKEAAQRGTSAAR